MRSVLRLIGSRYGIALLLLVVVLAVVGTTRALHGHRDLAAVTAPPSGPATVLPPTTGSDGVAVGGTASGTGTATPAPTATVTPSASTFPGPDPVPAVTAFTRAWLAHTNVTQTAWYAGITPYLTSDLATKLKNTDPADVPAARITGPVTLSNRSESFVQAAVPVDSGTVRLSLALTGGKWLVQTIDWDRS